MRCVSQSQIRLYEQCPRKWGYRYLDKLPDRTSRGAMVGTCCHWLLESTLQPDKHHPHSPSMFEDAGLTYQGAKSIMEPFLASEHMPPVGSESEVKWSLSIPGTEIELIGYIDWVRELHHGPDGGASNAIEIGDLKTCKSFRYAMTATDLIDDWQSKCYAAAALAREWNWCRLKWVYVKTTKNRDLGCHPPPRSVEVWVGRAWADKAKKEVISAAKILVGWYEQKASAADMEPKRGEACEAYGGCPYRQTCVTGRTTPMTENDPQSEITRLLAGDTTAPPAASEQLSQEALLAKIAAMQAQLNSAEPAPPVAPPVAAPVAPPAPQMMAPAEPPVAPPKKRGRPKGSKNKASAPQAEAGASTPADIAKILEANGDPTPPVGASESVPEVYQQAAPVPQPAAPTPDPIAAKTLYVNCGPVRETIPWVVETHAFLAAEKEAAVAAKAEHWALADYGQGPAILATAFARHLNSLPHAVRLSTSTMESRAVYSVLQRWATEIITAGG